MIENDELHEMYLERQRRLEEAIERAEVGQASSDDFDIIRFEAGLKKTPSPSTEILDDIFSDFAHIFGRNHGTD